MKKIFLFTALAIIGASTVFISSCKKEEETDLTTTIVGIYDAAVTDSVAGTPGHTFNNHEGMQVVKVDNTHIRFTSYNGGSFIECSAKIENITGSVTYFTIPSFSVNIGGVTKNFSGVNTNNGFSGSYITGVNILSYNIKSTNNDTEGVVGFRQ